MSRQSRIKSVESVERVAGQECSKCQERRGSRESQVESDESVETVASQEC